MVERQLEQETNRYLEEVRTQRVCLVRVHSRWEDCLVRRRQGMRRRRILRSSRSRVCLEELERQQVEVACSDKRRMQLQERHQVHRVVAEAFLARSRPSSLRRLGCLVQEALVQREVRVIMQQVADFLVEALLRLQHLVQTSQKQMLQQALEV